MEHRHSRICILGGGPTALLCQVFLRKKGIDACVIAESSLGNLRPTQFEDVRINSIPIFISPHSNLYRQMEWELPSVADYVTTAHSPLIAEGIADDIQPGSYADFISQRYSDAAKRLVITKKHLGMDAFQQNFPGLCRKVLSHYPQGRGFAERIGFIDGVSFYLRYIEREKIPMPIKGSVQAIDVGKKCVFTKTHRITYDRLISTLPMPDFLSLSSINSQLTTFAAGAQIVVFGSKEQNLKRNQLIYDCDATSPVHRVFIPQEGLIVAQVARPHWGVDDDAIAGRVQELFSLTEQPGTLKRFTVQNCYPLAVSDYALKDAIISGLERSEVTLFGRFAEWEYRDIEELNWERIECLS